MQPRVTKSPLRLAQAKGDHVIELTQIHKAANTAKLGILQTSRRKGGKSERRNAEKVEIKEGRHCYGAFEGGT